MFNAESYLLVKPTMVGERFAGINAKGYKLKSSIFHQNMTKIKLLMRLHCGMSNFYILPINLTVSAPELKL